MKKKKKIYPILHTFLALIFLLSACSPGKVVDTPALQPTQTLVNEADELLKNNSILAPCDLVTVTEMEEIFQESPLFITEEDGGCVVRNQWDTRSIWFFVVRGEQALPAMRWHTKNLVENWPSDDLNKLVEDILVDENNQSLDTLQQARLTLYEELEYRWERIFTFGDVSYWIIDPRAFKGVFDVVEGDVFYQMGYSGFLAAQVQPQLEDLSTKIFSRLPETFVVDFDFSIVERGDEETPIVDQIPRIVDIDISSREIYFGSLCEDETTTIQVVVENENLVDNVFLVYRLRSNTETNDNWTTRFMRQLSANNWEIILDAENSFGTYQLVDGAQVEYSIALIYEVNKVLRSETFRDIVVIQCKQ